MLCISRNTDTHGCIVKKDFIVFSFFLAIKVMSAEVTFPVCRKTNSGDESDCCHIPDVAGKYI